MKKNLLSIILIFMLLNVANTQTKEPSGKPFVNIFSNYHSNFGDGENHNLFQVTRAYFGYEYNFNQNFSAKLTLDFGNPGVGKLQQTAYLKNAYLKYKEDGLSVTFGLLGLLQFKTQEKNWGNRYVFKSFQDEHKFNSSADLGLILAYDFSKTFSMDFSLTNGEGYKTVVVDSILRTGIGATLMPSMGFTVRAYYDFIKKYDVNQQSVALFAGYVGSEWAFGAEYNQLLNVKNTADKNLSGYSFYTTYKTAEKTKVFARYDRLTSNEISGNNWNLGKDGSQIIVGMEFAPVKGVKISPNYQGWSPKDDSKKVLSAFYLSLEFKI